MKKIIVTGGLGFIGYNLIKKFLDDDFIVYSIDSGISGTKNKLIESNKLKHFELTDRVERELNKQKPFTSLIRRIYYLPLNILKYYKKKQLINEYEWTLKEIEILEKELKNFQK